VGASFRGQGDDEEQIKFVSMIDQKPIQPSYLELITLKNFPKKEQEAQRQQFKDSQKQESNDTRQAGMSTIHWAKLLHAELGTEYQKRC
jgi:alpha-D-ribose 1-methylphosphonate 5-triphosphate diphosphatase PhnM